MNDQRLADARLAEALRAAMPAKAPGGSAPRLAAGLRDVRQVRPWPLGLGVFTDVDPLATERKVVLLAALLAAILLGVVATLGALGLWSPRMRPQLSLDPPADPQAYVVQVVQDSPVRVPMAFTVAWDRLEVNPSTFSGPGFSRVFTDGAGDVRIERYASPTATEPSGWTIYSRDRIVELAYQGAEPVWIERPGIEDARFLIYSETAAFLGVAEAGCEATEVDPTAHWEYVGLEHVIGRPAHHLRCGGDLWVDVETRLVLRSKGPLTPEGMADEHTRSLDVTALDLEPQPRSMFDTTAPNGVRHVTPEEQEAYLQTLAEEAVCRDDVVCSAPEVPVDVPPRADGAGPVSSADALVAAATAMLDRYPSLHLQLRRWRSRGGEAGVDSIEYLDGEHYRIDWGGDATRGQPAQVRLVLDGEFYRSTGDPRADPWQTGRPGLSDWIWDEQPALPDPCETGWQIMGVDTVGPFTADHLACGDEHWWVDRETGFVVRWQWQEDRGATHWTEVREVTELALGTPASERLRLPDGAIVLPPPTDDPDAQHTPAPVPSGG